VLQNQILNGVFSSLGDYIASVLDKLDSLIVEVTYSYAYQGLLGLIFFIILAFTVAFMLFDESDEN
jgi:hypothetical protein